MSYADILLFQLIVNQKELCQFEYRMPLSQVNHLFIDGSADLHGVNWGGKYYVSKAKEAKTNYLLLIFFLFYLALS